MVLYSAASILIDITAASFWIVKKTFSSIYYLIYGKPEVKKITLTNTLNILEKQNEKIGNLEFKIIELTKYIINNKVHIEENNQDDISSDFIDLKAIV